MSDAWRKSAEQVLLKVCGEPARAYSTRDFGREQYDEAVSVVLPKNEAFAKLEQVRSALPEGLIAFVGTTRWLGKERNPDKAELVVAPGESQFDILVVAESRGANYDLATGDLIQKLQQYDAQCAIDIIHAETDTVEFRLGKLPANLKAFAEDLYEFCPDIVEQGVGSMEALVNAIQRHRQVFLWWG